MTAPLIVRRMMIKPMFPLPSVIVKALFETFIRVLSKGRIIGKLRIAMSEKLLLALEAMAATIVRMDVIPRLPSNKHIRNNGKSTTLLPIISMKKRKLKDERMTISSRL